MTPSTLSVVTRSVLGHGGGNCDNLPRLPRAVKIISYIPSALIAHATVPVWLFSELAVFQRYQVSMSAELPVQYQSHL